MHRHDLGQQRRHVDGAGGDEAHGPLELTVEAERAAELDLLGDERVHRQGHVAAEAELDHDRPRPGREKRAGQGAAAAGCLEDDVEPALVGVEAVETARFVAHVDGEVGADAPGKRERLVGQVGRHHFACAGVAGDEDRQGADRAGPGHQNPLAQQCSGLSRAVQANGQRLGKGGVFQPHAGRQLDRLVPGADQHLAEPALHVREAHGAAEEAHVETVARRSFEAEAASAAGSARVDRYVVAGLHVGHGGANHHHLASDLVARDQRFADADRAEAAVLVVVQVRAADAAVADAHLDVVQPERRDIGLPDSDIPGGMDDYGLHGRLSVRFNSPAPAGGWC